MPQPAPALNTSLTVAPQRGPPRGRPGGAPAPDPMEAMSAALIAVLETRLPALPDPGPEYEKTQAVLAHEAEQLQQKLRGKVKPFHCMADRCLVQQMTNAPGAVVIGCIPGLKETKGFCSQRCFEMQMATWTARPDQYVMHCQQLARVREDTAAHVQLCEAVPPMKKGGGKGKKPPHLTPCKFGKKCTAKGCKWMHM